MLSAEVWAAIMDTGCLVGGGGGWIGGRESGGPMGSGGGHGGR